MLADPDPVAAGDVVVSCELAADVAVVNAAAEAGIDVCVVEDVNVDTWMLEIHSCCSFSAAASLMPFIACGSASALSLQLRVGVVGGVADMDSTMLPSSAHETEIEAGEAIGADGRATAAAVKFDFVFSFGLFSFVPEDLLPSVLRSTATATAAAAAVSIARRSNRTLCSSLEWRRQK